MIKALNYYQAGCCCAISHFAVAGSGFKHGNFPSLVVHIEHETLGHILFDTGYSDHFFQATTPFPERLYRLVTQVKIPKEQTVLYQLNKKGISANQIKHIIVSHFHADHIAGLEHYPQAKIHCIKAGYQQICTKARFSGLFKALLPKLLPLNHRFRVSLIDNMPSINLDSKLAPFISGYDIFNDGSIIAIELPGHALGQIGIYLSNPFEKFFVADACWSELSYKHNKLPSKLSRIINYNQKEYLQTIRKLSELHRNNRNLCIVPSHCTNTHKRIMDEVNCV